MTRQQSLADLLDGLAIATPQPVDEAYVIPDSPPVFGFSRSKPPVPETTERRKESKIQPVICAVEQEESQERATKPGIEDAESDDESIDYDQPQDELYDEAADEEDATWLAKQLQPEKLAQCEGENGKKIPVLADPSGLTDAMLSCSCCFTPICLQCQKHASYQNQWRAVTAQNCRVEKNIPERPDSEGEEVFYAVLCEECGVQVGVQDAEEVFHFYNVIPSSV